jgi:hypothetical protein
MAEEDYEFSSQMYVSDDLNYLSDITVDGVYNELIQYIDAMAVTLETKNKLMLLVNTYIKPVDFVVTNIRNTRHLRDVYTGFRESRKVLMTSIRQVDNTADLHLFLTMVQDHLKIRVSRSQGGFERMEQRTTRSTTDMNQKLTQGQQKRTGLAGMFRGD